MATTRHHSPPLIVASFITTGVMLLVVTVDSALVEPSPIWAATVVFGYTSYLIEFIGELLWDNAGDYSRQSPE